MAFLAGLRQTLTTFASPQKPHLAERLLTPPDSESSPDLDSHAWHQADERLDSSQYLEGETFVDWDGNNRKRPSPTQKTPDTARKRQKTTNNGNRPEDEDESDFEGVTLITSTPPPVRTKTKPIPSKKAADRALMPPPATPSHDDRSYVPPRRLVDKNLPHNIVRKEQEDDVSDEEIFGMQNAIKKNGPKEVIYFDQQKALRFAQAMTLPPNSGFWAAAEKDLFFRLAFRGFEPLVPGNWTNDFKTLPQTLFSTEDRNLPIIQSHQEPEFRAIHALHNLFALGMRVRDRAFSLQRLPTEPVIRRKLRQYISWALTDVGLHPCQRPNAIPVHVIATRKRGQSTQTTLKTMTRRLHKLASRYQNVYGVRESTENSDSSSTLSNNSNDDSCLPILTGFMICSSLVIVMTFNPRTNLAQPPQPGTSIPSPNSIRPGGSPRGTKEESGPRFIATFDFSDRRMDVWHALAIAICVMRARKTMQELCMRGEAAGEDRKGGLWEKVILVKGSTGKDDDPDQ